MCKSAFSLCIFSILASLKKVYVIVDRRNLFNLCTAENVRSAVADVTGIVRDMCIEANELHLTALNAIHNVTNSPQVCMVYLPARFLGAPCAPPPSPKNWGGGPVPPCFLHP